MIQDEDLEKWMKETEKLFASYGTNGVDLIYCMPNSMMRTPPKFPLMKEVYRQHSIMVVERAERRWRRTEELIEENLRSDKFMYDLLITPLIPRNSRGKK